MKIGTPLSHEIYGPGTYDGHSSGLFIWLKFATPVRILGRPYKRLAVSLRACH